MLRLSDCLLGLALIASMLGTAQAQTRVFSPRLGDRLGAPALQAADYPQAAPVIEPSQPDAQAPQPSRSLGQRFLALLEGRTQIEGGYSFACDRVDDAQATQHVVPDLLVRYGLTDRLELRIGWPGFVSTHYGEPLADRSRDEVLDPNVGFLFDLWPQRGWLPQAAVLASVPITLRGNPFTMESLQPLTQALYCWRLNDRLTLGGTTGAALFRVDDDNFIQFQQTASLDWSATERMATFVEWEMLADHGSDDDGAQHLLGLGVCFLLTEQLQLTWRAGVGLNDRAPDFVTGIYFAYRL